MEVTMQSEEFDVVNSDSRLPTDQNNTEEQDEFVKNKIEFINRYKKSSNTANSTIDDNSNVSNKNIAILNSEIHKPDNVRISRAMIMSKLKELYPDFNAKRYIRDLEDHVIYKHDESSFAGAISPYCVSVTMYPFLMDGIKGLGGLSASPKNLKSFCGIFCNMIFAISSQFAGAVAVSEALMYFTYFCKKEWGPNFYKRADEVVETTYDGNQRTILKEIQQYWQQIVYTINQPAAARGFQSAFVNFSYFDRPFFEGMFGEFYFPDGTQPDWESLKWIQMEFMKWFNEERLKTILTFPVETVTLLYKDGKFVDEEMAQFVYDEYARGHSFFTYISDTVDSLSSCCFGGYTKVKYSVDGGKSYSILPFEAAYTKDKDEHITIQGFNPYTNEVKLVTGKFVKASSSELYKITSIDGMHGRSMIVTHDHLFPTLVNNTIFDVEAKNLRVGDKLLVDMNFIDRNLIDEVGNEVSYAPIISIEKIESETEVYCVELDDRNSPYFVLANGIITHNCRLKNKLQTKEFSFTTGNVGVQTGSKSVITFNLNRLIQAWYRKECEKKDVDCFEFNDSHYPSLKKYLLKLLERVYKYHHAYNELLWDMYDADLLPAYRAGFIDLNKQYLTLGLNGLNQAAEFLGIECSVNDKYAKFCQEIFSFFKEQNERHKDKTSKHHLIFNTEQVPAESLGAKNAKWDSEDGYVVPEDTNLYASYVFKPNDPSVSVLDKITMHGRNYIGDWLDGGAACHINLDTHLTSKQYEHLLNYAAQEGCNYLTFNIPMTECKECCKIVNAPIEKCPECGSTKLQYFTRIIGYLTAVRNWSSARQKEFEIRLFGDKNKYTTYKAK